MAPGAPGEGYHRADRAGVSYARDGRAFSCRKTLRNGRFAPGGPVFGHLDTLGGPMSADHACPRCRTRCEPFATREQLTRFFVLALQVVDRDAAQLAEMVSDLAGHCPPCVDATLEDLYEYCTDFRELVRAGATAVEASYVLHARRHRAEVASD